MNPYVRRRYSCLKVITLYCTWLRLLTGLSFTMTLPYFLVYIITRHFMVLDHDSHRRVTWSNPRCLPNVNRLGVSSYCTKQIDLQLRNGYGDRSLWKGQVQNLHVIMLYFMISRLFYARSCSRKKFIADQSSGVLDVCRFKYSCDIGFVFFMAHHWPIRRS